MSNAGKKCKRVCVPRLRETVVGTERDSVWLLGDELGLPVEVPVAAVALETTPLQVAMPALSSEVSEREGDRATESSYNEVRKKVKG